MTSIDPRTPVLVGVGTCLDDAEAADLMVASAQQAGTDAGAPSLLAAVQQVAVPRGTWGYTDPGRLVREGIGAPDARSVLVDLGIPQQTPIDQAMAAIVAGELDVALVVGAEAKARAARAAKRSTAADAGGIATVVRRTAADEAGEVDQQGATPDEHQQPEGEIVSNPEIVAALYAPVQQYALMESALGAAEGRTVDELRDDVAGLWSRFNEVAGTNPEAAFPERRDASALRALGPGNRPLAFPYGKWHASQWTVDQGAALLLCSAEAAERHGVPHDRWLFPLVGVESSFALPISKRREVHRWPAMRVLGEAAAQQLGHPLAECEHAEVYSCFPVAVRVQQRELGLPVHGTPTITGGMAFGGGPFNSFVLQATAAMARRLREEPGKGLVTTVSGFLTKPGLAIWSSEPDGGAPLVADLGAAASAATEQVDVLEEHHGPATVVAATVTYDGEQPVEVVALLDTTPGPRVIAKSRDVDLVARATTDGLVGRQLVVAGNELRA
jgi:acetyl-CoA C-acetyltransferase